MYTDALIAVAPAGGAGASSAVLFSFVIIVAILDRCAAMAVDVKKGNAPERWLIGTALTALPNLLVLLLIAVSDDTNKNEAAIVVAVDEEAMTTNRSA
jgi:hypothetical protein